MSKEQGVIRLSTFSIIDWPMVRVLTWRKVMFLVTTLACAKVTFAAGTAEYVPFLTPHQVFTRAEAIALDGVPDDAQILKRLNARVVEQKPKDEQGVLKSSFIGSSGETIEQLWHFHFQFGGMMQLSVHFADPIGADNCLSADSLESELRADQFVQLRKVAPHDLNVIFAKNHFWVELYGTTAQPNCFVGFKFSKELLGFE